MEQTMEVEIEQAEHELVDLRSRQKDLQRQLTEAQAAVADAAEAQRKAALEAGLSGEFGALDAHEQAVMAAKRHEQRVAAALEQVTGRLNDVTTRAGAMRVQQAKEARVAQVRELARERKQVAEELDRAFEEVRQLQLRRRELGQRIEKLVPVRETDYALRGQMNAMLSVQTVGQYVMRQCLNLEQAEHPFSAEERGALQPFLDYSE